MKRNDSKGGKRRRRVIRLWTHNAAHAALPYIGSVLRSARDHHLELMGCQARSRRLADKPGRPDRTALIDLEDARREAERAAERFQGDLEELQAIDVYCLDPVRGEALIPFAHDDKLAWYVYGIFDEEPLRLWRYHSDPLDCRRPLAELETEGSGGTPQVA